MQVAVIGAGSWGTAISWLLSGKGIHVSMWAREPEIALGINEEHHNPVYLPEVVLPQSVRASHDMEEVLRGAEAVVIVTPSHGVRETAGAMKPHLGSDIPVINLAKGVEGGTLMRMTQVVEDVIGGRERLAALSGPNHAEEVSKGVPSATVIAAYEDSVARMFQELFMAPSFRVYTNTDIIGVELGGASKNVIAVAAGMSDGLGFGDNTKATLMTRGLAEMSRLGRHLGANPLTYMGLAGMGDLIATCTSQHSRNRALGQWVAEGGTVDSYAEKTHMVAEGARSAVSVYELACSVGIELPITHQVKAALYEGASPDDARVLLMGRSARDELHGMDLIQD
ncbi:MAG: NAD(P)-dependent glycerol-3-phosphate dehydrogenase [Coriobacteriia bacterium]|nr:NAD(P)-dependent glycerol-3-phosphate dehydrogenase [Coriobacteriia bacterium]